MSTPQTTPAQLLPVVKVALLCAVVSLFLAFLNVRLSVLPLGIFLVCCLVAPFFPSIGFFLPVISRGCNGKNMVALTFDDGPEPETTPGLLKLLSKFAVKATFFVIGEKVHRYPELVRGIIAKGHSVGNHSYHHDVFLMVRSTKKIDTEIRLVQDALCSCGIKPFVFRPPVGITNPKLGRILKQQELCCVNFSCRGFDAGNRRIKGLAERILKKVRPGDIILLHDCVSPADTRLNTWLLEIEALLVGLAEKKLLIEPLEQMICRPVCTRLDDNDIKK